MKTQVYESVWEQKRGLHIVVINPVDGAVVSKRMFDTHEDYHDSEIVKFLNGINDGKIVVFAILDEGSDKLGDDGRNRIKDFGSTKIQMLSKRDMWAFVTWKNGPAIGEALSTREFYSDFDWAEPVNLRVKIDIPSSEGFTIDVYSSEDTVSVHVTKDKAVRVCPKKFENYRREGGLCDVTLKVGNQNFPAHRVILAEASSFFESMFMGSVGYEKKSDEVKLNGIEPDTFEIILDYIYGVEVKLNCQNAKDVILAAHLYDLKYLIDDTAVFIRDEITVDNAVETYHLASKLNIATLEQRAIDVIAENIDVVAKPEMIPWALVKELAQFVDIGKLIDVFKKWMNAKEPKAERWDPIRLFDQGKTKKLYEAGKNVIDGASLDEKSLSLCSILYDLHIEMLKDRTHFDPDSSSDVSE